MDTFSIPLAKRIAAEALGTGLLLASVVGSGIMAQRLSEGNLALALLANAIATGAALAVLILTFGPISGAHFNPIVTVASAMEGGIPWKEATIYVTAQGIGGVAGTLTAHLMFQLPLISISRHERSGGAQIFSEFVATFGLVCVIWGVSRTRPRMVAFAVASYIVAAYWFTASTSFANPAVTLARAVTDTFSGIRPADVPGFIGAQLAGGIAATLLFRWLMPGVFEARPGHVEANNEHNGGG